MGLLILRSGDRLKHRASAWLCSAVVAVVIGWTLAELVREVRPGSQSRRVEPFKVLGDLPGKLKSNGNALGLAHVFPQVQDDIMGDTLHMSVLRNALETFIGNIEVHDWKVQRQKNKFKDEGLGESGLEAGLRKLNVRGK